VLARQVLYLLSLNLFAYVGLLSSYFKLPATAGMIAMHHRAQLLVEMRSLELFAQAGIKLQSSPSQSSD
jgi:hypothetical protein